MTEVDLIGIIEKVLVECLLKHGGEELRQDVFWVANIPPDRVYRMDRHYPDEETGRLLAATFEVTNLAPDVLFDTFSETFMDVVSNVFPQFIAMSKSSEDLVRKQAKIHALIAAGTRADGESALSVDKFRLEDHGMHHISVHYRSELQLCGLYKALVRAAARRFGDDARIEETACRHEGATACVLDVKWHAIAGVPTQFDQTDGPYEAELRRA
ncbi:heme NO-binding domain-containing protein [Roseobacteraceae bacterium S113]